MRKIPLLLLALILVASADTVTLQPDPTVGKDTYVYEEYPSDNYGTADVLYFGAFPGQSAASFIEFTDLNDAQYQGATVNSAFLYIYGYSISASGQYLIGPCNAAWDEMTITWNTMVGVHETNPPAYPSAAGWMMYGVSGWVQNWLDGTWNNNGFAIFDNDGMGHIYAHSSDYSDTSLRPYLYLDYTTAGSLDESTWGHIKAGF